MCIDSRGMKFRELAEPGDCGLQHGFQGGVAYVKYGMVNKPTPRTVSRHSLGTVFIILVTKGLTSCWCVEPFSCFS